MIALFAGLVVFCLGLLVFVRFLRDDLIRSRGNEIVTQTRFLSERQAADRFRRMSVSDFVAYRLKTDTAARREAIRRATKPETLLDRFAKWNAENGRKG